MAQDDVPKPFPMVSCARTCLRVYSRMEVSILRFNFQPAKHTVLQLYTVITAKVPAGNSGGEVGLRQLLSSFIPGILLHVANWHDDYFDTTCVRPSM